MGFQNEISNQVIWANIANGKVVLKSKTQLDGYVGRTNKIGNQVFEQFWDKFEGKLTNVRTQDGEYGVQWFFEFADTDRATFKNGDVAGTRSYIITTGYDNRYARTLLNRLLNKAIDFNEPITIRPYAFVTDDDRKMSGVNVFQFNKKLNPRFLPDELPKPQEVKVKKQVTYNYSELMEFLEDKVKTELLPRLTGSESLKITTDKNGFINIEDDINEPDFYKDLE